MSKELIRLRDLCMAFDDELVLDNINLYINDSEFLTLLGPSGCGKTTTLRIIGGFTTPTSGDVTFDGVRINDAPPHKRQINTVFQKYALFPHLDVFENIAFGLRIAKVPQDEVEQRVTEMLEVVSLKGFEQRRVDQLSGGQQQRVAIARALATQPKVLLCDEATSALDPNTTHQILELIRDINQKLGITVVVITHQMSVVKTICNHVAILDGGEVAEKGLVSEVFAAPKSAAGRRLVFPGGADALVSDPQAVRRVRLTFRDSVTTGTPLVARLASEEGILCTVISASTQKLSEEVYGSMLLGIPSGQFQRAMDYISTMSNIRVEEVDGHVQ